MEYALVEMDVRSRRRVLVSTGAVLVWLRVGRIVVANSKHDRAQAETDEHHGDRELERGSGSHRKELARCDQHAAYDDERHGMSEPPHCTQARAVCCASRADDERRYRREMIGLERMAQADERTQC